MIPIITASAIRKKFFMIWASFFSSFLNTNRHHYHGDLFLSNIQNHRIHLSLDVRIIELCRKCSTISVSDTWFKLQESWIALQFLQESWIALQFSQELWIALQFLEKKTAARDIIYVCWHDFILFPWIYNNIINLWLIYSIIAKMSSKFLDDYEKCTCNVIM